MQKIAGVLILGMLLLCGVVAASNVTITSSENIYYFGEIIGLSGVNHASDFTYLYLKGANQPSDGAHLLTGNGIITGDPSTFIQVPVKTDGTWEYSWDTGLRTGNSDPGTYSIFASAYPQPYSKDFETISLILQSPFAIVQAAQSPVIKYSTVKIEGTVAGKPLPTLAIWIFGENYANREIVAPNSDGTFSYNIDTTAATMTPGKYYVIVQNPHKNRQFDVIQIDSSLRGAAASEALITAINEPNIDDTYSKTQFTLVALPTPTMDYNSNITALEQKVAQQETLIKQIIETTVPTTIITTQTPIPDLSQEDSRVPEINAILRNIS